MNFYVQGFTKSLAMTVLSEIGDKTFFAAAVSLFFFIYFFSYIFYFVVLCCCCWWWWWSCGDGGGLFLYFLMRRTCFLMIRFFSQMRKRVSTNIFGLFFCLLPKKQNNFPLNRGRFSFCGKSGTRFLPLPGLLIPKSMEGCVDIFCYY